MRKEELDKKLRRRIMEIYKETRNKVRIEKRESESFWTEKGVRQGCPMSPLLFNIHIGDIEEEMRKGHRRNKGEQRKSMDNNICR